ncbi:OmpA family protein [Croceitalea marina]|uniref:OmpA family protein n=1 Tax=Croceitalea marina TaxID=1775166 RepID=A0ABW5MWF8_9FLAO
MRWVIYVGVVLFCFQTCSVFAQNLVKNPSFEDYHECPNILGTFNEHVKSWSTPTAGTTDYFNTCSKVMSAPENFNGVQHPKDGEAYAGLYFYAPGDYREYIQVALKTKLRPDKEYQLSFYISLAEGSDFAVKDFGVVCSYKQIALKTKKNLSRRQLYSVEGNKFHSFEINHPDFHEDKSSWLKVSVSFVAKGYERFLVLGNLRNNKLTRKVQTKRKESKKGAYYYIDEILLKGEHVEVQTKFKLETLHEFENILFDFDVFSLDEISANTLKELYTHLNENPRLHITILGHTDNRGSKRYNKLLSLKRAESIAKYLVELGLSKERIDVIGYGSSKPLLSNNSEEGRKKNRRVEFILKE